MANNDPENKGLPADTKSGNAPESKAPNSPMPEFNDMQRRIDTYLESLNTQLQPYKMKEAEIEKQIAFRKAADTIRRRVGILLYVGAAVAIGLLFYVLFALFVNVEPPDLSSQNLVIWLVAKALVVGAIGGVIAKALSTAERLVIPLSERDLLISFNVKKLETQKTDPEVVFDTVEKAKKQLDIGRKS